MLKIINVQMRTDTRNQYLSYSLQVLSYTHGLTTSITCARYYFLLCQSKKSQDSNSVSEWSRKSHTHPLSELHRCNFLPSAVTVSIDMLKDNKRRRVLIVIWCCCIADNIQRSGEVECLAT